MGVLRRLVPRRRRQRDFMGYTFYSVWSSGYSDEFKIRGFWFRARVVGIMFTQTVYITLRVTLVINNISAFVSKDPL